MLEANEIIRPFVQLGLAPDMRFAKKILHSLDSRSSMEKEGSEIRITLQDFTKIFRKSKASDQLLSLVDKECLRRSTKASDAVKIDPSNLQMFKPTKLARTTIQADDQDDVIVKA